MPVQRLQAQSRQRIGWVAFIGSSQQVNLNTNRIVCLRRHQEAEHLGVQFRDEPLRQLRPMGGIVGEKDPAQIGKRDQPGESTRAFAATMM